MLSCDLPWNLSIYLTYISCFLFLQNGLDHNYLGDLLRALNEINKKIVAWIMEYNEWLRKVIHQPPYPWYISFASPLSLLWIWLNALETVMHLPREDCRHDCWDAKNQNHQTATCIAEGGKSHGEADAAFWLLVKVANTSTPQWAQGQC